MAEPKIVKPRALKQGDKIGIIAPASSFNREGFLAGCDRLRRMGYAPVYSDGIFDRDLYFAGPVERRVRDLEEMLERTDIAAVICARGGYGSNYLLERLNFDNFARHPKIFLGCSDVTSLLTAVTDRTGLVTFHGPMVAKDIAAEDGIDVSSWNHALQGANAWEIPTHGVDVLRPGRAEGRLYGGCLSLLVASLGTEFEVRTNDTVLFMEDVAEKPYRIDRMLMQLRLAGKLDRVRGIVFGQMLDCVQPGKQDYTLPQVVMRVLKDFKGPVAFGLRSGHVSAGNITLPLGVRAELVVDGSRVKLSVLEPATI
ncbi:MAG TPA: LD-carboxypeptidase [Verrucomicrobiae bacterium]|nr:LD-carboxypeptidase [Verrucomicrobiae bacterium]